MSDSNHQRNETADLKADDSQLRARHIDVNTIVSIGSFLVSFIALMIAVRSCVQVDKASELAQKEFDESRATALKAEVKGYTLEFAPTNPETTVDTLWLSLPASVFPNEIKTQSGSVRLDPIVPALSKQLSTRVPNPQELYLLQVPIGVRFIHVTKGDNHLEYQIYLLTIVLDSGRITIDHISFVGRLASDKEIRDSIEEDWTKLSFHLMMQLSPPNR